jgi:Na+/H+ antiporter NhaD/arsenite permease-like protein
MWTPEFVASILVFAGTLALVALFERYRVLVVAIGAALVLALGLVSLSSLPPSGWAATSSVIQWNTLGLIAGLFLFSALFGALGLPRWAALRLARGLRGHPVAIFLALALLAFALSMFLNSVAVVIIFIPVSLEISRELNIDPIPLLLAEISSANLGGTATLLGNPPNLILGGQFGLTFSGFLEHAALPAAAALAVTLAWFISRLRSESSPPGRALSEPPAVDPLRSGIAVGAFVVMGAFLFEATPWGIPLWVIGVSGGIAALLIAGFRFARELVQDFDWSTVLFLLFLFVLVGGLQQTGVVDAIAGGILATGVASPLLLGVLLIWVMAFASAFVDNIPLAAVAGPLILGLSGGSSFDPKPLAYASAVGLGVGGNGSSIGSISNVSALTIAEKDGVSIRFVDYLRRAFPIMVLSLAAATAVWVIVG